MDTKDQATTHDIVKEYYGKSLQATTDLKTNACCDISLVPNWLKKCLSNIHPEVLSKYYGCGLVCPSLLEGCRVLDLGCGAGRDVYALAQLVGSTGKVVGVDMTDEQLAVARQYQPYHAEAFGYDNVQFLQGYIEQLDQLGLEPHSFDIIVSNCVINLSPDKSAVLKGISKLLKPGGEFFFSDVYSSQRVPAALQNDPVIYGECLGGALYWNDFLQLCKRNGFNDPRLVEDKPIYASDPIIEAKLGALTFYSATYRLFAIDNLELSCEDFGQAVRYVGNIKGQENTFILDKHHTIKVGKVYPVCGNTFLMLQQSRFSKYFEFYGNFDNHHGIFPGCGESLPFTQYEQISLDTSSVQASPISGCC